MAKYHNVKCSEDGYNFDSLRERSYYLQLKSQMKAVKLEDRVAKIDVHPKFLLQEAYYRNGKKIQAIYYEADFEVTYADYHTEVIDVKGVEIDVFKIKRKMFEYKYLRDLIIVK